MAFTSAELSLKPPEASRPDLRSPLTGQELMPTIEEMLRKAVEEAVLRAYWEARKAEVSQSLPAHEKKPEHVIEWNEEIKAKFVEWMKAEAMSERYVYECIRYLNKFMRPIRSPADVASMFAACRGGRQHLDRGFRNLLKFYEDNGLPKTS